MYTGGGGLRLLGSFNRDGTPAKPREPTAFAKYVSEHFSTLKGRKPHASHKQLMAELGAAFRAAKQAAALGGADVARCVEVEDEAQDACLAMIEDSEWAKRAFRNRAEPRTWKRTTDQLLLQFVMMRGFCGARVQQTMLGIYEQEWRPVGTRVNEADGNEITSIEAIS